MGDIIDKINRRNLLTNISVMADVIGQLACAQG